METNHKSKTSQAGMSILEVLLSVGVLSASSLWTLQGFNHIAEYQGMSDSATMVQQFDQMAKKSLGRILQETMRNNIDVDAGSIIMEWDQDKKDYVEKNIRCDDANKDNDLSSNNQDVCKITEDHTKECKLFSVHTYVDVYDYAEVSDNDQSKTKQLFASGWSNYLASKMDEIKASKDSDPTTKDLLTAMERCQKNVVDSATNNMLGKSSFVGCIPGGSKNVFIEYKATLWDFHADKPILCENLHGNLGRGLQVYYQGWALKFNGSRLKKESKFYSVTRFGGNMSIPKIVFKRGLEKYVGQEANQQQ